jgi:hypothetical protein
VPKHTKLPLNCIEEWLNSFDRGDDWRIVVRLEAAGTSRLTNDEAAQKLKELVKETGLQGFVDFGYSFSFDIKKYYWDAKEIYVTPNEALFLFRWLVLNDEIHRSQWFFLRNMRKRLGKKFLTDISV